MRLTAGPAALVVCAVLAAGPASAGTTRPYLRLVGDSVHASHFKPREVVRVAFTGLGVVHRLKLRTTAVGTLSFAVPMQDPCAASFVVVVRGASGDLARLKLPQRECAPG